MFIVSVTFRTKPDQVDAFREAILYQARSSRENEPGCRQFDVNVSADDPTLFFVYEIYDDEAAFETHRGSPHSARTREAVADLLLDRELRTWHQIDGA